MDLVKVLGGAGLVVGASGGGSRVVVGGLEGFGTSIWIG